MGGKSNVSNLLTLLLRARPDVLSFFKMSDKNVDFEGYPAAHCTLVFIRRHTALPPVTSCFKLFLPSRELTGSFLHFRIMALLVPTWAPTITFAIHNLWKFLKAVVDWFYNIKLYEQRCHQHGLEVHHWLPRHYVHLHRKLSVYRQCRCGDLALP